MTRRGFTLLEVLVVLTILLIVGSLLASLLVDSTRAVTRNMLRSDMLQSSTAAMQRLLRDLRSTSCEGLSLRSGVQPRALAVTPVSRPEFRGQPLPLQNDGTLRWSAYFIVYWYDAASSTLRRREWPPGGPSATAEEVTTSKARRLGPLRFLEILSVTGCPEVTLLEGMTDFQIAQPPGGADDVIVQPLQLRWTLQRRGNTGRPEPEQLQVSRSVFLPEQR